jgi:hypothetical protein
MKLEERKERELKLSQEIAEKLKEIEKVGQGDINEEDGNAKSIGLISDEIIETKMKVLGQMFKGKILFGEFSFRKGKCFEYKRHYDTSYENVRNFLINMLPYMKGKLTSEEKDILELILRQNYTPYSIQELTKTIDLKEGITLAIADEDRYAIYLHIADKIVLHSEGRVYIEDTRGHSSLLKGFYQHYAKEIEGLKAEWNANHDKIYSYFEKELEALKERCGHYLVLANITGRKTNEKE